MAYVVGQTIQDVITIEDTGNVGILGLDDLDFDTLEAYLLNDISTTAAVTIEEINQGQYAYSFVPSEFGTWIFHYIYSDAPTYREDSKAFPVDSTAEIVVMESGGTWTYSGDLTIAAQEVRFLIQDTDGSYPIFTDTEVAYALGAAASNSRKAAALLVQRLMARYAAMADTTELDLSVRASQLYDHYKDLLSSLNNPFVGNISVKPYAGGISGSDNFALDKNPDRTPGMFDRRATYYARYRNG